MDTTKILAFRHPSQAQLQLQSLVDWRACKPAGGHVVTLRSDLPSVLQKVLRRLQGRPSGWLAYRRGSAVRLFVAEAARVERLPAGSRGALRLVGYDETGRVLECGVWVDAGPRGWSRASTL